MANPVEAAKGITLGRMLSVSFKLASAGLAAGAVASLAVDFSGTTSTMAQGLSGGLGYTADLIGGMA